MAIPRFLQIHTLHTYSPPLLNRGDRGPAKRAPFGSVRRTRISSRYLERQWRTADDAFSLRNIAGATAAIRSRDVIGSRVIEPLREGGVAEAGVLEAIEEAFDAGVHGDGGQRQPLLLALPEVDYLRTRAAAIADACATDPETAAEQARAVFAAGEWESEHLEAFREQARLPRGIEGALFGRMVTLDPAASIKAAVHVADAFTVHREESGRDYFSMAHDVQHPDEDGGIAQGSDVELASGVFYGYVSVDVPGLVSNLEGCDREEWSSADRSLAGEVAEHLLHLIATVSPGPTHGSTAPYGYAELILVEAGERQPRSLSGAFQAPTAALVADAAWALARHLCSLDAAYGGSEARRFTSVEDIELPGAARLSLDALADWTADALRSGDAG